MKAITVRQPYAWAITRRAVTVTGKDIENRSWTTNYRGLLAIHAGTAWDRPGGEDLIVQAAWEEYIRSAPGRRSAGIDRKNHEFVPSAIVAVADFNALHGSHACARRGRLAHLHPDGPYECSRWARGGATGHGPAYHWELSNVRALPEPVPCRGWLSLWDLPKEVEAAVVAQLEAVAT